MEILALIPARSGSKSVPDKNIRMIGGKPMLAWSIGHALGAGHITRVIVSTDSEEYADIARKFGADVPFIRPAEYATDTALDIDVFKHALTWLEENEGYRPDIIVQLRPTYPKRRVQDIQNMIEMLKDHPEADSVRSVAKATEIPYKMWVCEPADEHDNTAGTGSSLGRILPIVKDIPECYNMPRQELPTAYYQNACVDVMRYETVMKKNSMTGDVILGYLMDENYDIDTEAELEKAQKAMPG
ncbi:MAG: acylneuraminate cytidylyltransferase family protein [Lachnospiraceae bacterium]|nr:acylneuraminate cytidylyltransferase family protein [Lachnospiraceae bacterium]